MKRKNNNEIGEIGRVLALRGKFEVIKKENEMLTVRSKEIGKEIEIDCARFISDEENREEEAKENNFELGDEGEVKNYAGTFRVVSKFKDMLKVKSLENGESITIPYRLFKIN